MQHYLMKLHINLLLCQTLRLTTNFISLAQKFKIKAGKKIGGQNTKSGAAVRYCDVVGWLPC